MVRKSNKTNAAEKTARKRRGTRRRKDSSSESEPESNPTTTEENLSAIALPKDNKKEDEVEVESSSANKRTRRVSKRNATAKEENNQEQGPVEGSAEWNEDESFWTGAASSAATSNEVVNEEEGATWKIQSSNGSGGEIQKLKICRQRPTDSTGSCSPAKECSSPRVKRMAVPEKIEGDNAELELDAPMDIVDVDSEKVVIEQIIPLPELPQPTEEISEIIVPPTDTEITTTTSTEEIAKETSEELIIPGLDLVGEGQQKQDQLWMSTTEPITELSMIEMPPEERSKEEAENELRNIEVPEELPSNAAPLEIQSPPTQLEEEVKDMVEDSVDDNSSSVVMETTEVNIAEIVKPPKQQEEEGDVEDGTIVQVEIDSGESEEKREETAAAIETEVEGAIVKDTSISSIITTPPANKCLAGGTALSVSSELAMEQIAKKLNERAARGKEMLDDKDNKNMKNVPSREESPDFDRGLEEGEIVSSAGATPDPSPLPSKLTRSTSVFSKPEEVVCLPTILKRNLEEFPPEERIPPGLSKKRLCLSPQISITSDLLKILEPNIQPASTEEVDLVLKANHGVSEDTSAQVAVGGGERNSGEVKARGGAKDDNNDEVEQKHNATSASETNEIVTAGASIMTSTTTLSTATSAIPSSTTTSSSVSTNIIENKCDDVEVTVSNDVREVKKKKPIVIDRKSPSKTVTKSTPGPKLPAQENHKATRKISIVSADAKALRKSPSPSKKKATEVLYITNLVRPFTVPQLRELLARTGTIAQNGFYIDKIKSKCYVKYTDIEMAIETRHALHGVRWPVNNPKTLRVDFASPSDMAVVQKLADEEAGASIKQENEAVMPPTAGAVGSSSGGWLNEQAALKPSRRVTATVREWDMGKIVGEETSVNKTSPPIVEIKKKTMAEDDWTRKKEKSSRSDKERDRRRPHSPEHNKTEPPKKIKKKDTDAPARLLDDLFRKTKATPCIYWLPLTAAQIAVKEEMRRQHMAEHERRLAELRKTDTGSRRDNKDRERDRDRRKK